MGKEDYETWVARKGRRHGKPYGERKPLAVPWNLARGNYEALSDLQLREALNDLGAEAARRGVSASSPAPPTYDPLASQIRTPRRSHDRRHP